MGIWSCKTCMKPSSSESMLVFQETQVAGEPADPVRKSKASLQEQINELRLMMRGVRSDLTTVIKYLPKKALNLLSYREN